MKNILVLIDDVKSASAIAHYALQIAVATQANLLFGHAAKISAPSQCINNKEAELIQLILELKKSLPFRVNSLDYTMVNFMIEKTSVVDLSLKMVAEHHVKMIIMGSQKSTSISRLIFGSLVEEVLDRVNCTLLIVPNKILFKNIKQITFAANLSHAYQYALKYIAEFGLAFNAKITVNQVVDQLGTKEVREDVISTSINKKLKFYYPSIEYHTLMGKNVEATLNSMLDDQKVDLLCLVHQHHDFFSNPFYASISKQMAKTISIPILILPYQKLPLKVHISQTALEQFCYNTDEHS